ncbi:MAG: MFS transporter [Aliivibrio sp.]|uniref:MFS transporter n=1 Tax=Aliivibrio sp. TaxID=1872443 RepID=UPI001A4C99CC|nr:MFS transporter [Aliivibrio sp.]
MNKGERTTAISLALVFVFRMLGLFMLMPVLALYASDLNGYSLAWVGIAIGAYGCTQALLQIPAGWLSDKYGRKPIIIIGLLLFVLGSIVAAESTSIYGVALGRAIQGMGAIAAAVLALASDLTRPEQRTKVMAIIGISIGMSFAISMILGPFLAATLGLSGLFYVIAIMAVIAIFLVLFVVPTPVHKSKKKAADVKISGVKKVFVNSNLLKLDFGVFVIHCIMTSLFIALPLQLAAHHLAADDHWHFYLPVFLLSFLSLGILMRLGKRNEKVTNLISISCLMVGIMIIGFNPSSLWLIGFGAWLYFSGFNYLEASMPSLLSKIAPDSYRGSASGVYSTSQFLGAFFGGVIGGGLMQLYGAQAIYFLAVVLLVILFVLWRSGFQSIEIKS